MALLPRGLRSMALRLSLCLTAFATEPVQARFAEEQQEQPLYTNRPPHVFYHNVGLLQLFVSNLGQIGVGNYHLDTFSAGWRGGEYLNVAAPWIAAIAPDNLTYCSTGATPGGRPELLPSPDPVDTVYPAYEGAHGGNRLGFSQNPDDDGDGLTDEDVLNGRDDDLDGKIDEDFAAISQQMYSCEYRDDTDLARRLSAEHRPLGIRIQQRSYAWSTASANEFVGFDFDIINEGVEVLRQVYLGFFVDGDAGSKSESSYFDDDAAAFLSLDTTFVDPSIDYTCSQGSGVVDCAEQRVHLDMMYIQDVPDDGVTAFGGDVSGCFGTMLLGHTTDPFGVTGPERVEMQTARYFTKAAGYPQGDPRVDAERYEFLASGERAGRPSTQPGDYRYVLSAGPFAQVSPGERLQLQVAFVIGEGKKE